MVKVWYLYWNLPFHFIIFASRKHWTFQSFSHFFSAVTKIIDSPHVWKFDDLNLCVTPIFSHRSPIISTATRIFTCTWCLLVIPSDSLIEYTKINLQNGRNALGNYWTLCTLYTQHCKMHDAVYLHLLCRKPKHTNFKNYPMNIWKYISFKI